MPTHPNVVYVMSRLKSGGIEWLVMQFLKNNRADLGRVTLWLTGAPGKDELYDEVEDLNVDIIYGSKTPRGWKAFKSYLLANSTDVVHAHTGYPSGFFIHEAMKANVPVRIGHWHNVQPIPPGLLKSILARIGMKRMARSATHIWAVSEAAKSALHYEWLVKRAEVVPNGYRPKISKASKEHDKLQITHIGRFHPVKNHARIWSILEELNVPFRFTGCGRHDFLETLPSEEWLNSMRRKHNDEAVINLPGNCTDVSSVLASTDVFLFPSKAEGAGGALIEAAASGCYCVASDIASLRSVAQFFENVKLVGLDAPLAEWVTAIEEHQGVNRKEAYATFLNSPYNADKVEEFWLKAYRSSHD